MKTIDPDANIFDNPNQQGTPYPAWFIVHRSPVEVQKEIGRYVLVYQIDIWYMLKQNITRLYDQYSAVAEQLDDKLEYLPIYGTDDALVHVYDRSWGLELNALKYSTTLRLRVSRDKAPGEYMQVIEDLWVFIKSKFPLIRVYFTNTTHPELDIEIPQQMFAYYGTGITLPTITGVYRDSEGKRWEPLAWNIGAFGETTQPLYANTTANLVIGEVIGIDTPMGGTVGIGENYGTDTIMRLASLSMVKTPDYRYSLVASNFEPIGSGSNISLDRATNYDYAQTLSSFAPLGCGLVEPWTPPVTEKEAYFTNQGSNRTSNYNIGNGASGYQLFDPDGNHLYASEYETEENYSPVPWTMIGIYDYSGNYVSVTNRYSLKCEKGTGYLCLRPDGWVIDYHSAYKVVYKES